MATVTRCYEIANGGAFCTTRALLPEGTFSRVWDVTLAEAALIDDGALLTPAEEALVLTLADGVLIAETGSPFLATTSPHTVMLEWQKPEHVITIDMPETIDSDRLARVEKLLRNKTVTDPDLGTITVYDDDNTTPLLAAELFEDAGGTQAYRGKGADRRDRLV